MSLQCPKCDGVVLDRRSSKCGFCGAELPADFRFKDTEAAAVANRLKIPQPARAPRLPISTTIMPILAVLHGCMAATLHRWYYWLMMALALGAILLDLIRYAKDKREYENRRNKG